MISYCQIAHGLALDWYADPDNEDLYQAYTNHLRDCRQCCDVFEQIGAIESTEPIVIIYEVKHDAKV